MRIHYCCHDGVGAWYVAVLRNAGHEVTWTIDQDKYSDVLKGIIPPPRNESGDLTEYDLIIFEFSTHGELADELRLTTPVIGSSAFAERLEFDRLFGLQVMEECGIEIPPYEAFNDVKDAKKWLSNLNRRCVFKPCGQKAEKAATYVAKSVDDMMDYLDTLGKKASEFILQEFVEGGTEVSTNAWFNGTDFYAMDHDLEEKKFMNGGLGPNTGCSGCLVWMPTQADRLFVNGLAKAKERLAAEGFVGPIDLNTIATEGQLFGLEWTPRFGYEGTCNTMKLLPMEFGEFLHLIATGQEVNMASPRYEFAATVKVSVPPYPNKVYERDKYEGIPVKGVDPEHTDAFYLNDVQVVKGEMCTLGTDGEIGAPIGCGNSIKEAFENTMAAIKRLEIPDLMYRTDIEQCVTKRYNQLCEHGWLKRVGAASA
jgi:phosphoribosylamine-glycine ligase